MVGIVSYWVFFIGTTLTIIVPGPNAFRVLDFSVKYGAMGGVCSSVGMILADLTFMTAAVLGLSSIFNFFPSIYGILLISGAIYFFVLSLSALRRPFALNQNLMVSHDYKSPLNVIWKKILRQSYTTCLLNFKAIFFYTMFFPKFIDPRFQPSWLPFVLLCLTVLFILAVYYSVISLLGLAILSSKNGLKILGLFNITFGIFMGLFSLSLLFEFYKFAIGYT